MAAMVIDTIGLRGSLNGGLPTYESTGTALFSFEGMNLIASSTFTFDSTVDVRLPKRY
jgi:hypothetical protein